MSSIQVGNVVFESTGNNRLQYTSSNTVALVTAGQNSLIANSSITYLQVAGQAVVSANTTTTFVQAAGATLITANDTVLNLSGNVTGNVFPAVLLANSTITTNVSTITFTGFVNTSLYSRYLVHYNNVQAALNNVQFRLRILDTNSTSLGANISYVGTNDGWGGAASGSGSGTSAIRLSVTQGAGNSTSGSFYLNVNGTTDSYIVGSGVNSVNSTAGYLNTFAGRGIGNTGGIDFSDSNNGTFSAGSFYVFGIKK